MDQEQIGPLLSQSEPQKASHDFETGGLPIPFDLLLNPSQSPHFSFLSQKSCDLSKPIRASGQRGDQSAPDPLLREDRSPPSSFSKC